MKNRLFILFSAALNVALGAAIFLQAKKSAAPILPPRVAAPVAVAVPTPPPPIDAPVPTGPPFQWEKIVSPNLKIYRDNLRAIGCPELTVREIMRAVINELFGARRRDILASFQSQYWDMAGRGDLNRRQAIPQTEWGRALASLTAERLSTVKDVLGRGAGPSEAARRAQQAETERQLSWLPPEKRARLISLKEEHQRQVDDWFDSIRSRADPAPTPEDRDRLQAWQTEFDEGEKTLLTPAEFSELQLRQSDAVGWAASLPGFNPSEEQWRALTELRNQYEAAAGSPPDPSQPQESFDEAVKGVLDPDSFAQFQLATNDQYQSIHSVTARYGLSDTVAAQGLDVQQAAEAEAAQIRGNANLSPEEQQAALNALQQQTEQSLGQMLGADALSTYKEYGGDWVTGLSQTNQ